MKKLLVSLIVLIFAAASVSANMVVNGGFETPHFTGNAYEWFDDGENIGGWDVSSPDGQGVLVGYDTVNTPPSMWKYMAEGTQLLHIGEGTGLNTVSQTISGFTVGAKYELSLASCEYGPSYANILYLQVYNAGTSSYDLDITYTDSPPSGTTMEYSYHEFTASGTTLELMITNDDAAAMTIDDVSIVIIGTKVGTTVPTSLELWEKASQGPTSGTFTLVLDNSPSGTDTITVDIDPNSNGNGVDLIVSPEQLTFTSADWDTAQTVTVTAINDTIADGQTELDQVGFTVTSALSDPCYASAIIPAVEVTIHDDDSDAVVVSKAGASATEGGAGDSYTIKLATDPTNPVTIIIASTYMVATSPTDPNLIPDPFDCQLTVNGGGSATLVFTAKDAPQTVNIAAVDDSLYETDPHVVTIGHHVVTDDPIYSNISAANVDVSITENDARAWSFGDDVALTVSNYSFEDPCLADGGVADFNAVNPVPGYEYYASGQMAISNPTAGEWATMYKAGHQQAPDGEQILYLDPGEAIPETALDVCTYLIEPGPVSYTFEVAVGVPEPNYAGANVRLIVSANDPAPWERFVDTSFSLAGGDLVAGEWVDVKACGVIEADSDSIGGVLSVGLIGSGVHVDNWRLTVANHPCDGCTIDPDDEQLAMDFNGDCKITLADFAEFAADYLDCYLYPDCIASWDFLTE